MTTRMKKPLRKPKIMSFTHYGKLYGANRSLLTLIIALKHEVDWIVICQEESEFTAELKKQNITYRLVPFTNDVYLKERKFQLLHSWKRTLYNALTACYTAFLAFQNDVDFIHSNSSVILVGAMTSFLSGKKHLWHIREFVYDDYHLKYFLGERSFRFFANKATNIISISNSIYQRRIAVHNITAQHTILYNGLIDNDAPRQISNSWLTRNPVIVGIVGIIDPAKNQLTALKAVNLLVKKGVRIVLNIIGSISSKSYFEELLRYVADNGLTSYVNFTGYQSDIESIFKSLDITLMCSLNEALGRVTIESMMYGIPVIAYNSAGSTEIISHGHSGLLYHGDHEILAKHIEELITTPDLYNRISINGAESAMQRFTIKSYADGFMDIVRRYSPRKILSENSVLV